MEVRCQMLAMKEWHRESGHVVYSSCCVLDAPPDLPDGDYTVYFERHSVNAVRQGGLWLPHEQAELLPPDVRTEIQRDSAFRFEDAVEILPVLGSEAA